MFLEKEQTLFSIMLEDTGLILIAVIPINVLQNTGHRKGVANKNYFHSNGEENYRLKNQV